MCCSTRAQLYKASSCDRRHKEFLGLSPMAVNVGPEQLDTKVDVYQMKILLMFKNCEYKKRSTL